MARASAFGLLFTPAAAERVIMEFPEKISFMYEVSGRCNLACAYCYNAWKTEGVPEPEQLDPGRTRDLLAKVIDETGCSDITLSGGEPLLREDIFDIISFIKGKGVKVGIISNGLLLTGEVIDRCLSCGVDLFQITLLADEKNLHNRLTGAATFDRAIEALLDIKRRGGKVCTYFVGLADNMRSFRGALELNVLLGVREVALGRFVPGGSGLRAWESFMPSPGMLESALEEAETASRKYGLSVSVATPIMPCLVDISRFKRIKFGFCSAVRKEHSIFGIDPSGNLKACSHSPHLIGDLLEQPFEQMLGDPFLERFASTIPAYCEVCPDLAACRGGCRSSAQVCYGSFEDEDPFLHLWKGRAQRPVRALSSGAGGGRNST